VIKSKAEITERVRQSEKRLESSMRYRLGALQNFLSAKVGARGFIVAEARIRRMAQRVDDLAFRLEQTGRNRSFTRTRTHRVEICEQRLSAAIHRLLKNWHQSFARIAHTLDALSPLAVLERGYAICLTPDGRVVKSAEAVGVGDELDVRLHEGRLTAKILTAEQKRHRDTEKL
jgi:exodeoxyribonuclease VII large subunit